MENNELKERLFWQAYEALRKVREIDERLSQKLTEEERTEAEIRKEMRDDTLEHYTAVIRNLDLMPEFKDYIIYF